MSDAGRAKAMVAELTRGRLATASINVVQTAGLLMMLQGEPGEATHVIGRWFSSMTQQGREQILGATGETR